MSNLLLPIWGLTLVFAVVIVLGGLYLLRHRRRKEKPKVAKEEPPEKKEEAHQDEHKKDHAGHHHASHGGSLAGLIFAVMLGAGLVLGIVMWRDFSGATIRVIDKNAPLKVASTAPVSVATTAVISGSGCDGVKRFLILDSSSKLITDSACTTDILSIREGTMTLVEASGKEHTYATLPASFNFKAMWWYSKNGHAVVEAAVCQRGMHWSKERLQCVN
jgi:hypothetical protein